jgi:hypothetical protein
MMDITIGTTTFAVSAFGIAPNNSINQTKSNPPPCNPATTHCGQPVQTTCNGVACHKEPFTPQPWTKQDTCGALFAAGAALTGGTLPGVVTSAAASWWAWTGAVILTAGQIPCL